MFEAKPIIDEKVAVVFTHLSALKRGDVLRTETIEQLTGCQRYEFIWNSLIQKLKRRMRRERFIVLWPVTGVGYKLCTHEEQLNDITVRRQKRAFRQLGRSISEVSVLPSEELSVNQQRARAIKVDDMKASRRLIRRQIRQQKQESLADRVAPTIASARRQSEQPVTEG